MLSVIVLSVIMLGDIMLSVIMLGVIVMRIAAPDLRLNLFSLRANNICKLQKLTGCVFTNNFLKYVRIKIIKI